MEDRKYRSNPEELSNPSITRNSIQRFIINVLFNSTPSCYPVSSRNPKTSRKNSSGALFIAVCC